MADKIDTADCNTNADPVRRMVRDLPAEAMVEWMIKSHGLHADSANTVAINLREQFKWHRLQGRLDRQPFALIVAELLQLRRSVETLETPRPKEPTNG